MALKKLRMLVLTIVLMCVVYFIQILGIRKEPILTEFQDVFLHPPNMENLENGLTSSAAGLPPQRGNPSDVTRPVGSVIPKRFYEKKSNVSPHNFRYMYNPEKFCKNIEDDHQSEQQIFLLVMIASASWEFDRRKIIRHTWASASNVYGRIVKYIFFVGVDLNEDNNRNIQSEFEEFGDLVQEDYHETYRNLSIKTQGQLKWSTHFCSNSLLYMHVDDDVIPDIPGIVKQHLETLSSTREISCAKVFQPKVRRDGKWMTSREEYSGDQYPLSCVGWCFVMPADIVKQLYYMSLDTYIFHLEDVWTTGILREKIGDTKIRKMDGGESMCQHLGWPKDKPINKKILIAWRKMKRNEIEKS